MFNDLSPEIVINKFLQQAETHYNLRHHNDFKTPAIPSMHHKFEKLLFLGLGYRILSPTFKQ